jgi:hypothetical protein
MKPTAGSSILAAALIVSLVLLASLSPSRALADELPKDTNQIERLTPEQAKKLAAEFPGVRVVIEGNIGTSFIERSLPLNGLKSLDAEIVKALAEFKGSLNLSGLTTLDAATAKTLAALDTWNGDLSSIVAIESPDSVEIAAALAKRKGPLSLPNLKKISPKTLTALIEKEDVVIPLIERLELIQEPDGSPTEDFTLPTGFQTRQKARQQGR